MDAISQRVTRLQASEQFASKRNDHRSFDAKTQVRHVSRQERRFWKQPGSSVGKGMKTGE